MPVGDIWEEYLARKGLQDGWFEEIEKFGTIKKVSKDKTLYAIICLAKFNGNWYGARVIKQI